MTKLTTNTFNDYLESTVKSDHSVADRCQTMLVFGHEHYKKSGDSRYFASMMNANFRASRRDAFRAYIVAHTNLKCVKDSEDETKLKFVKDPKSANKTRTIALPKNKETGATITWYEFTKETIQVDFDIDARIKALINQAKTAIEDKTRKIKGTRAHIKDQVKALEALAAAS